MGVNRLDDAGKHQEELNVFIGRIAGIQKIHPIVRSDGPVVVFSRTVDSRKRLLMKQACHPVTARHLFHGFHHELVVIHCDIGRLVDRSKFMLCGSHLVMLGLCRHSQLPQLQIQILHVCAHALSDGSEIVILHLLSFGCGSSEQCASRKNKVGPF